MIQSPDMKTMIVTHFHWTDWPDHDIPNSYSCPLHLLEMVIPSYYLFLFYIFFFKIKIFLIMKLLKSE